MPDGIVLPLFRTDDVTQAVELLSRANNRERGAVFTRKEVVDFILELVGYTQKEDLYRYKILEPSFGNGDFLLEIVRRLLQSYFLSKKNENPVKDLQNCIRAVELHRETFDSTKEEVKKILLDYGLNNLEVEQLVSNWLINDDFLLVDFPFNFTYVVGNPPYVRQELIPSPLISEYRRRFKTIYDRADLYIPFIEKSLLLLDENGSVGIICSDRWMKNKYGGPLRELVAKKFHLRFFVDVAGLSAFNEEVSAYTAITIISREKGDITRVSHKPNLSATSLKKLAFKLLDYKDEDDVVKELVNVAKGSTPWLLNGADETKLLKSLEEYPTLEEEGCKVGIGVATGCDQIFIGNLVDLPVEEDRKLPLLTTSDISSGKIKWGGTGVINPFDDEGNLVNLSDYPKLKEYFEKNINSLKQRHVAKKNPRAWYRTIDKIYSHLKNEQKLLIPDIKFVPAIVLDNGKFYPHHNLYYVTPGKWDLNALQAVLKSSLARFFISAYSVKVRGNYLRFQAQYLRRIRIPKWENLSVEDKENLITLSKEDEINKIDKIVFKIYNLNQQDQEVVYETLKNLSTK